ncbi:class I adenylate-forming enzyme family protein [Aquisalimonas sp.]|uniref:class I adenylate-forming enzyme family protein n=1 Tax=Aquisalimonas sp. TaxID=1872621 RepID=UPI0025BA4C4B|nr:class I adenylate-forming enzyme family protein [Aquisalimonas sp.]
MTQAQMPDEQIRGRWASEILAALPQRISHQPLAWARETPEALAVVDGDVTWNYADLAAAVEEAQQRLADARVGPGDRIMVLNENCRALVAMILAASEMDVWCAVVSARISPKEIEIIADSCKPRRLVFTTGGSPDAAGPLADQYGAERIDSQRLGEIALSPMRESAPEPVATDGAEQVATLIYTSGTTGTPKGVMLTHRNMLAVAAISGGLRGLQQGDRVYGVLPISHVFGLSSMFLGTLYAGATLQLSARFDPASLAKALAEDGVTVLQGVPAMFQRLLEYLKTKDLALEAPQLRYMSVGGAPLDPSVKERVESAFGLKLHNGYGLTEAAPTISQTRLDGELDTTSCGPVLPLLEYRLQGSDGNPVGEGEIGELWVRGPTVMKGYYRQPEATAEVIDSNGWLNTGDMAQIDAKGNLHIVGRSKELIIRSGFNVYPPDVEAVLTAHPDVTLSAVVGRSVVGNEEVVAYVQLAPGSEATAEDIRAFAAERLAPYKRPSEVVIMEHLPATPTGKILKGKLNEMIRAGQA